VEKIMRLKPYSTVRDYPKQTIFLTPYDFGEYSRLVL
jgi:hypothetical protein